MPCGHQASQDRRRGSRKGFQGTFNQRCASPLLSFRLAVMSRDHRLEIFIPSKHFAFVGGFCVHGPALFPHSLGVDDQRERDAVCEI